MEVHKPYMKYEPRWKKHGIFKLATYFIVFLMLILLIFLPVFRVDFTKMDEEQAQAALFSPSTLPKLHDIAESGNWLFDENAFSFSFSIFDEAYAGRNPILDAFPENGSGNIGNGEDSAHLPPKDVAETAANAAGMAGTVAIIALAIGAAGIVVLIAVTLYRTVSTENYAIHMYDKIKWRRDSESGWHKQRGSWMGSLDAIFSIYIAMALISVLISLTTSGNGYTNYTVSYFSLMTGVSGWLWFLAVLALAAITLQIAAAIFKSRIRTDILHEEYDTPPVAPQSPLEEPFPELSAARQHSVAAAQQNQLPQGTAQSPYGYYPYPASYPQPNAAQNPDGRQAPAYGYYAPQAGAPDATETPAAPQTGAPNTTGSSASGQTTPPQNPTDGNK